MAKIGYLHTGVSPGDSEENAAWTWTAGNQEYQARLLGFRDLTRLPDVRRDFDVLWWHLNSGTSVPSEAADDSVLGSLRQYLHDGGSLLLTLAAAQYVVPLGIEANLPNQIRKGEWGERSWAEDYPDIRGMASFQGHPVFRDLAGGVYTWDPVENSPYTGAIYEAPVIPRGGRVVAVERQYIKLNEDRRIVCEWEYGKGKVLSVGSFLYFSHPGKRFAIHRNKFVSNCLRYLDNSPRTGEKRPLARTYWNFDPQEVYSRERRSSPVSIDETDLGGDNSGLSIVRDPESEANADFNVGGRRLLVMGKEQDGIKEIWCPPFRLVRSFAAGFRLDGGPVRWLRDLKPKITARPESMTREYSIGEMHIEERTFTGTQDPSGCVHYSINSNHPLELVVSAQVDLRLMWPYSERATGSLVHSWDEELRAAVVTTAAGDLAAIIGTSVAPIETLVGQWEGVSLENNHLNGIDTEEIVVEIGLRIPVEDGKDDIIIGFAGSDSGEASAEAAYRGLMKSPRRAMAGHAAYFQSLFRDSLSLTTPDENINDGYRWALASTDRCFVETPKLGSSLIAGIGTTERGWDGGQRISGRPGYAWYFGRDAAWTAFPMLSYGDYEKVRDVLEFLGRFQDLSGKILHELTTSGHVHYDAADSTPLYLILMGRYLRMTGDVEFIRSQRDKIEGALEFCFSTDTDQDLLIENTNVGHGWVEGGPLFPVHTEIYLAACWAAALDECAQIERQIGNPDRADSLQDTAQRVRERVRREFWNSRTGLYNFAKRHDGTYVETETVLSAVASYFDCTDPVKSQSFIRRFAVSDFSADWGVRILPRSNEEYNPRGYHSGSVWPLFTGWASLAEFKGHRPLQGLMHVMSTLMIYREWAAGTIEEVLQGEILRQAGVCSHQGWSESMVLQPLLEGMLGISSDASKRFLAFRPYFPFHWKFADVGNMRCGDSTVDVSMRRNGSATEWEFGLRRGDPVNFKFTPVYPPGVVFEKFGEETVDTTPVKEYGDARTIEFKLEKKKTITIVTRGGVAVLPSNHLPSPGNPSEGLRIVEERRGRAVAEIDVEGREGRTYDVLLWDPDNSITGASGAVLADRVEGVVRAEISFPGSADSGSYVPRTITLNLKS